MENPEEVLQSLDEFAKLKPKDIPRELEEYLLYVAKTGDPVYQWSLVKSLFREKMVNVITDFYESCPTMDLPPCPNVDPFNYETMKTGLLERLDSFVNAPFTVQRICELLTTPRKEYTRVDKFMRAIEKNILVVSTKEPGSSRRAEQQSDLLMNGVMDGRALDIGEAVETVSTDSVGMIPEAEATLTEHMECGPTEEMDVETGPWDKSAGDSAMKDYEASGVVDPAGSVDEAEAAEDAKVVGEVVTAPADFTPEVFGQAVELGPGVDEDDEEAAAAAAIVEPEVLVTEHTESHLEPDSDHEPEHLEPATDSVELTHTLDTSETGLEMGDGAMSPLDGLEDSSSNISPPSPTPTGSTTPPFSELGADEDTQDAVRSTGAEEEELGVGEVSDVLSEPCEETQSTPPDQTTEEELVTGDTELVASTEELVEEPEELTPCPHEDLMGAVEVLEVQAEETSPPEDLQPLPQDQSEPDTDGEPIVELEAQTELEEQEETVPVHHTDLEVVGEEELVVTPPLPLAENCEVEVEPPQQEPPVDGADSEEPLEAS